MLVQVLLLVLYQLLRLLLLLHLLCLPLLLLLLRLLRLPFASCCAPATVAFPSLRASLGWALPLPRAWVRALPTHAPFTHAFLPATPTFFLILANTC